MMSYRFFLIFIFLLIVSCANQNLNKKISDPIIHQNYSNKGFTLVYTDELYKNKTVNKKATICSMYNMHERIMNSEFERLILICCVDTPDLNSIEVINTFCCLNGISLILAWDNEELGRYVETISVLLEETGIGECINLDFLTIQPITDF